MRRVLHRGSGVGGGVPARLVMSLGLALPACSPAATTTTHGPAAASPAAPLPAVAAPAPAPPQSCEQLPALPAEPCKGHLSQAPDGFAPIDAPDLIALAKKGPGEGGVCDARAFRVERTRTIYRAYNGTNPASRLGNWWALEQPSGAVSAYRENYQICYQWTPLDRLVRCTLSAGAEVVLGTGQSIVCSKYLNYPTSASVQLYIADAAAAVLDCAEFDAIMAWQPAKSRAPRDTSTPAQTASARD